MKRKSLVSLSAALPIAALAAGTAFAHPPVATAATLPSTPAKAVQTAAEAMSYIIIIITGAADNVASSGIKTTDAAGAAKSLDT
jgi:hypothetical protein